ncbi:unnamed protein product [Staurois parvus]|uniref:Uncharacterized protein n=1 Tax=Staurois parvus TaxID=386267 RepID=A0ABN9A841_9NEOB|nr:unnamed protein product [Staurois parvus]
MYTHTRTDTHTCAYTQTHIRTYTCTCTHTHTHSPMKSCSTSLFTHRAGYCTLGGGREHSTHSFLCFHCAQLLSSLTAPSASDRSGPEFRACSARWPWGHTRPTTISTRHWRVEISRPDL